MARHGGGLARGAVAIEPAVLPDERLGPAAPDHERLTATGARLHGAVVGERDDLAHRSLCGMSRPCGAALLQRGEPMPARYRQDVANRPAWYRRYCGPVACRTGQIRCNRAENCM